LSASFKSEAAEAVSTVLCYTIKPGGNTEVKIIEALRQEAEKFQKQADALKQAAESLDGSMNGSTPKRKYTVHRKKHRVSAAGRRAISIAQKKRWAAKKA